MGGRFDFFDAGDVECATLPDVSRGIFGNQTGVRHDLGSCRFDRQPGLVASRA